jgi:radical SAM protein with 4Fe4S-binding SPASM domain
MRIFRVLSSAAALAQANLVRLSHPLKVNLCVTYWCQYRCKTCNIWQRKPVDELSTSELLRFIDQNPSIGWLDITGGEIFLRPDIHDLLDAIVTGLPHLAILHFPTNGFLTDAVVKAADRLRRTNAVRTIITVSLDGDERLNDDIRGITGGYRRQIDTFRSLRAMPGIEAALGITLSVHNAGHLADTLAACHHDIPGLRPDEFHVNVAQVSTHYYGNDLEAVAAPLEALEADLATFEAATPVRLSPKSWVERTYLKHLRSYLRTGRTPMPCHALRSSCFIDPWGVVYPCITYARPIGRLRDTDMALAPIWEASGARELQAEIWRGNCPQCWTACEAYQSILGNIVRPGSAP